MSALVAVCAAGVAVACLVDAARLAVYAGHLSAPGVADNLPLLLAASACAFAGAFAGARILGKMTLDGVNRLVGWMLLVLAGLLATGIV